MMAEGKNHDAALYFSHHPCALCTSPYDHIIEDMGLKNYSTDLIQLISTSNARLANSCQNHHLLLIRHATASKSNNPRRIVFVRMVVPRSHRNRDYV